MQKENIRVSYVLQLINDNSEIARLNAGKNSAGYNALQRGKRLQLN